MGSKEREFRRLGLDFRIHWFFYVSFNLKHKAHYYSAVHGEQNEHKNQ